MPKPLAITIEVEEVAAGGIIRLLNKTPGVVTLHLNLDHDVRPPTGTKKNGEMRKPRTLGEGAPRALLYKAIAGGKGKPVHRDDIHAAVNPNDEPKLRTTARNVIYNTVRSGFIKQTGKDHFALTERGKKLLTESRE